MMLLALVVAATAVAAVPVERTNGVLSTVYRDDFELSNNQHHFVAFNRGCPGCRGGLVPHPFTHRYPYQLTDTYEERGLVKRSPLLPFPFLFPIGPKKILKKKLLKDFPLFWLSPVAG